MSVTAQAGVNGRELERALNERGLMLPHYPASSEWATVGGYVAARGSGVLSTRYGKIEDLVLSLRVALAGGELIDTVSVPRHAVGPELTQLFVGSEGTLGIITRATLEIVPLPPERRFFTLQFPDVAAGIEAFRSTLAAGYRPSVIRMYDEEATARTFAPVVGEELAGVCAVVCCEGEAAAVSVEGSRTVELARGVGARELDPALAAALVGPPLRVLQAAAPPGAAVDLGHDRRRRHLHEHHRRPRGAQDRGARPLRRPRPAAADALLALVPLGHDDLRPLPDPGRWRDALTLHDQIWEDGITAVLAAGGVMNDHHGVGLKLRPLWRPSTGPRSTPCAELRRPWTRQAS